MCGIYFCFGEYPRCLTKHECLKNRGPDACKEMIFKNDEIYAVFYRLAIVDVQSGMQPFLHNDILLLCNGEIYNYKNLVEEYKLPVKTNSDCECIMHLYNTVGINHTMKLLDGEFAFILYDFSKKMLYFARDKLGRKPLFYSVDDTKKIDICSLYKGLQFEQKHQVEPRQIYSYSTDITSKFLVRVEEYFKFNYNIVDKSIENQYLNIKKLFENAVKERVLQSERPVGFLLSGGFDSSLVLSVAMELGIHKIHKPHVFTIGFSDNAPDIKSAEIMVKFLRNKYGEDCMYWHKQIVPIEEGLNALPEVIKCLETYDTTTIRASTPMYLISKYINENTDVKVILSGEGSDELFGGYLYFKYAPDDDEFQKEIVKRLNELYLYDVLRADRVTAHWGLEVRPPFLSDTLVEYVLTCSELKKGKVNTKELIRNAFENSNLLPNEILFGKKEAFSDAVGLSWKDEIAKYASTMINNTLDNNDTLDNNYTLDNNDTFDNVSPFITPQTDEMKYFQIVFNKYFKCQFAKNKYREKDHWNLLRELWLPNQTWVVTGIEPSARILSNYSEHVDHQQMNSAHVEDLQMKSAQLMKSEQQMNSAEQMD